MDIYSWILTLAIAGGQLIKIPVGEGGATLLDITILFLCLAGLIQIRFKFLKPPIFIEAGLFFCLIALLSLILTPLKLTLPQYFSSSLYIVRFFSIIFLGWLLLSGAFPSVRKNINEILLLSGVALAVLGLLQFILLPDLGTMSAFGWDPHYFRTVSTLLDPNFAGAFFVLTLILISANLGKSKNWFIYFILVYLALLTTFSRSSYLAFFTSFITLAFLHKSIRMVIVTIILFAGLISTFFSYKTDVAQPRGINRTESAESRFNTWQQGIILYQAYPILGTGFNTYRYALDQFNLGDENFLSGRGSSTNDSSILYVATTTGTVGLITFLFFLLSAVKNNNYYPLLTAAVAGVIIQSFFVNLLFYPFILIWIILSATKLFNSKSSHAILDRYFRPS